VQLRFFSLAMKFWELQAYRKDTLQLRYSQFQVCHRHLLDCRRHRSSRIMLHEPCQRNRPHAHGIVFKE